MPRKYVFFVSFFVLLFYSVFLQTSLAKNFFEVKSYEVCSNQESNNKNDDHNLFCKFHCFFLKFDDLTLKKQNSFIALKNFVYNQASFLEIYFKSFLSPKNNSPPKLL